MAFDFGDSFDLYAAVTDAAFGYWDSFSGGTLGAGRFANSRGWNYSFTVAGTKTSNVNDPVHHFVFSNTVNSALNAGSQKGFYITLYDGATAQCTVAFNMNGDLQLIQGTNGGTVIATYANALNVINTWFAYEVEVVIHPTNGGMTVRRNGNTSNDFTIAGLNTRASANSYANKITIGGASNSMTGTLDDFYWRSGATVAWMGDIRCYARMPVTDVQAQFSRTTTQYTSPGWGSTGISNAFGANAPVYVKIIPASNGNLAAFAMSTNSGSGGTGHTKAALFADNGGTVGALLATSSEVTNPGAGAVTFNFPTPAHVTAGTAYWIGFNQDASMNWAVMNSGSITSPAVTGQVITGGPGTYASWPVANPGGVITSGNIPANGTLVFTPGANADCVSDQQQDGFLTYVYDNNPGDADFYSVGAITGTPAVVFAVVTRAFMTKSDAGSRTATVQLRSGGATVAAPALTLTTSSFLWSYRLDLTDPGTGAAWTAAAVNAAQIGPKVLT